MHGYFKNSEKLQKQYDNLFGDVSMLYINTKLINYAIHSIINQCKK